jgi:fucose permease
MASPITSQPALTSRRLLFYTLYLAYIAAGTISILPGPTLSLLAAHTHVSLAQASWIFTGSATGFALGAVMAGVLGRWFRPKTILIAGLALMGGAGIIIPLAHSFSLLVVTQFTKGFGFGFLDVSVNVLSALAFHDTLGESLNGLHSSFGVGSLLAPLLLSLTLTLLHDFTWAYLTGSTFALLCIILLVFQRTPTTVHAPQSEQGWLAHHQSERAQGRRGLRLGIFGHLILWLMALEFFLYIASEVGFSNWIVTAVNQSAHIGLALAAPVATAFWLGLTASRLLGSQVLKRAWLSENMLLYLCMLGAGASGLLVAFFPGQVLIAFVASALFGFFLGPLYPGLMAIAARWFARDLNTISGVLLVTCGVSGMLFPVLMGLLISGPGVTWGMMIPALGCLLIALPYTLATRRQAGVKSHTLQLSQPESTIQGEAPITSIGQEYHD